MTRGHTRRHGKQGAGSKLNKASTGPNNPGASAYQYDAEGNTTAVTTTAGTTNLTWDSEDHLASDGTTTPGPVTGPLLSGLTASGGGKLCAEDASGATTNGTKIQIAACSGAAPQNFTLNTDGTLKVEGKCVTAAANGTTNGTLIQLYDCNAGTGQQWKTGPGSALINPASGRCLNDPVSNLTPGTQLQLTDCDGSSIAERWTTTASNKNTTYLYDTSGNQLIRRDPTQTTINLGIDEYTYTPNTNVTGDTRYYTQPNNLTIVRCGTIETFEATDPHGTAGIALDATTLKETRRYTDPFGNPRGTTPTNWTVANGFGDKGFVGGTQDPATGLTNLGAREYQPATGHFLNPDPLLATGDPQQWNGYAYSDNQPTNASDPTGQMYKASVPQ
ncbi:ricin-type beta-trefoil lectin domain protein [Streptacidiphilus cavernicola]|uniref:Ricin-type beta-trefoil lectin domain protein n=1 Tax=Streptacidiphilus cavernicola TaxID=3342716 RepID=A0ABV6VNA8_9ACTN